MPMINTSTKQLLIWIPDGMAIDDKTRDIANTMKTHFKVGEINNHDYGDNFINFYDSHIKRFSDTLDSTFCKKKGNMGVNMDYLIENANKTTYATVMSVNGDHFDDGILGVNAILIFRWSKTQNALKIQVLCADQRVKGTGDGTKLLNLVKKTLTFMNINNIYLNPLKVAVPYYHKNQFRNTLNSEVMYDSSDSSAKSKSNSKTKTKTNKDQVIPSMTMNLRARRNWNKTKKMLKTMGKLSKTLKSPKSKPNTPKFERSTLLLLKVDEIVNGLSKSELEMATSGDILVLVKRDLRNITSNDEDLIEDHIYKKYNIE